MNDTTAIWDLDNCLADDAWRVRFIRWDIDHPWDRYFDYHELSALDEPGRVQRMLFRAVSLVSHPVFITARPEALRVMTRDWIEYHLKVSEPRLLMRGNDDHRPSVQLKREHAQRLLAERRVFAAFDDHHDIVAMYRDLGLRARRVAINPHPEHYHPPGAITQ